MLPNNPSGVCRWQELPLSSFFASPRRDKNDQMTTYCILESGMLCVMQKPLPSSRSDQAGLQARTQGIAIG